MEIQPQPSSWLDRKVFRDLPINWEHLLWIALLLAAALTRFAMLEPRVMSHDEAQHTQLAWWLYSGKGYQQLPMTHGPFQIETVALSYFLFGASDTSSRVPAALFGIAAVMLPYLFRRWLGRGGALAAGALMTISPYMMFYSRYVRNESFVVVWGLLMFLAIGRYLESRQTRWLYFLAVVTALHFSTKETAYIYVGLAIIFLAGKALLKISQSRWDDSGKRPQFLALTILGAGLALVAIIFFVAGRSGLIQSAVEAGATPVADQMMHTDMPVTNLLVQIGLALLFVVLLLFGAGIWRLLRTRSLATLRETLPEIDLLVVLGTTMLPQLAAFPMALFNLNPWDGDPLLKLQDPTYLVKVAACLLPLVILAILIGLAWDRKKWPVYAGIFFGIFFVLYTTFFTNFFGAATGLIGNVNYWMAQQEVQRGGQPWYYYLLVQIPVYEYLPALLALTAPILGLTAWLKSRRESGVGPESTATMIRPTKEPAGFIEPAVSIHEDRPFPMIWLLAFWSVASLAVYSVAGEKMPWLTVHITLPLILVGGWVVGRIAGHPDVQRLFTWPRAIGLLVLPATLVAFVLSLGAWFAPIRPFSGNTLEAISASSNFVFTFLVTLGGVFLLGRLWRDLQAGVIAKAVFLGSAAVLAACTFRAAWMASFKNYDLATEFLVYAHSAPGVKTALSQVEETSRRTQDDLGIQVAYDGRIGWIMTWYMREFPNKENLGETLSRKVVDTPVVIVSPGLFADADQLLSATHVSFTYMRMWWPAMDYFDLTWNRIANALGSAEYRRALWDIWWNRDYTAYGQVSGGDFALSRWPRGEQLRLYIRKDLAARVWPYNAAAVVPEPEVDPYAGSVRALSAGAAWGAAGTEPGNFQQPRGIAVAPDGSVYVADTGNHRIQHFSADGGLITAWGSFSGAAAGTSGAPEGTFNEPWGIAVGPDGSVYVADTWNYRIQKFSADGTFIKMWGKGGSAEEEYGFYGPRAVAVDSEGRVFVTDTGNKRVVVYDSNGEYLTQIGSGGFESGQFDEPVGITAGKDGRLYVADTWNRRVQVFEETAAMFLFQSEWSIAGWEGESTDTKPYLAAAPDGNVWVTDPGNARVLVFDARGNFLFTFGQPGADESSFALPIGIAVGSDGTVYITDTGNNRVMVFAPQ
jgi:DNA-binding beta-propeller fold protein YncE/uncharacterized membrane protein